MWHTWHTPAAVMPTNETVKRERDNTEIIICILHTNILSFFWQLSAFEQNARTLKTGSHAGIMSNIEK